MKAGRSSLEARFDAVVAEIYRAGAGIGDWPAVMRMLATLTGSRHAMLQASTRRTDPATLVYMQDDGEIDHSLIPDYGEFMVEIGDPRVEYGVKLLREGRPGFYRDQDVLDERGMKRHPYYADILRRLGLMYGAVQLLPLRDDVAIGLTLQRTPRQGPASDAESALLRAAAFHIDRALQIHDALFPGAQPGTAARGQIPPAASVLDAAGHLLSLDAKVERYLLRPGLCRMRGNRLMGSTVRLHNDIARALFGASHGMLKQIAFNSRSLILKFLPLVPGDGLVLPAPRVLLAVDEAATSSSSALKELLDRHKLTQSERQIALMLARGAPPKEIASQREVSIHTVRTHLKSVYQKLGVRSQREAIAMLVRPRIG